MLQEKKNILNTCIKKYILNIKNILTNWASSDLHSTFIDYKECKHRHFVFYKIKYIFLYCTIKKLVIKHRIVLLSGIKKYFVLIWSRNNAFVYEVSTLQYQQNLQIWQCNSELWLKLLLHFLTHPTYNNF